MTVSDKCGIKWYLEKQSAERDLFSYSAANITYGIYFPSLTVYQSSV